MTASPIETLARPLAGLLRSAGEMAGELGFQAFLVGGLVRDLILGAAGLDVDIVIEGGGIAFAKVFAQRHSARTRMHEKFGTGSLWFPDGFKIDVATARVETYDHPAALPRVRPGTIRDDMYRRDFTVNAIAIALNPPVFGDVLDPFHGREDIRRKRIRVLHDGSFIDDPTRIFRAARFEKRLDFKIDEATERLIPPAVTPGVLGRLENYRIVAEIGIILKERDPRAILERLEGFGVMEYVRPRAQASRAVRKILREAARACGDGRADSA